GGWARGLAPDVVSRLRVPGLAAGHGVRAALAPERSQGALGPGPGGDRPRRRLSRSELQPLRVDPSVGDGGPEPATAGRLAGTHARAGLRFSGPPADGLRLRFLLDTRDDARRPQHRRGDPGSPILRLRG